MKKSKILIVEDEVLIAKNIEHFLNSKGFSVVPIAISYEEAIEMIQKETLDLVLLDIRLSGEKTGLDIGIYLHKHTNIPFIYLTSQLDAKSLEKAKSTHPVGYLSKPIQKESLYASIEIALHNSKTQSLKESTETILLSEGTESYLVEINDILYLESEHVYVRVYLQNRNFLLVRMPLKDIAAKLPEKQFMQIHRSFVVNLNQISGWKNSALFINQTTIAVGPSYKKELNSRLKERGFID